MAFNVVCIFRATRDGSQTYLSCNDNLFAFLVANGASFRILIVEHNGHGGLVDAGLAFFIDQFLQICGTNLHVTKNKQRE